MALALAVGSSAGVLDAQVIQGRLLTAYGDEPIELGTIELISEDGRAVRFVLSDADGRFALPAPAAGRYMIRGAAAFHDPLTEGPLDLQDGQTIEVEFRLLPRVLSVDSLLVTVERGLPRLAEVGFYERARRGHGYFLDQDAIERRNAPSTADLLSALPGVHVPTSGVGPPPLYLRGRASIQGGTLCVPTLYIDGFLYHNYGGTSINDVAPDQIAGIELYTTQLRTPSAYAGGLTGCGVILIWTRRR